MKLEFIKYLLHDVLFTKEDIDFIISIENNEMNISVNGTVYVEPFFDADKLHLNKEDYACLDKILENREEIGWAKKEQINLLKIAYYFSNEFYVDRSKELDKHQRVCLGSIKETDVKYLEFPIVNILGTLLAEKWNVSLNKKVTLNFTCDYDILNFWTTNSYSWAIKRHIKNVLKKPILDSGKELFSNMFAKYINKHNPFLNLEMFVFDEKTVNLDVENYAFMLVEQGDKLLDPHNNFAEPSVKLFLKELIDNNVKVGLHPNYNAHYDGSFEKQIKTFEGIFEKKPQCSRNHYLRGVWPDFLLSLETLGVKDDFTFGFADSLLFRGGMASPFKLWNTKQQIPFNIVLHPLTIMDGTLQDYQTPNLEESVKKCTEKLNYVYQYGNEITLLWHNRSMYKYGFENNILPELFQEVKKVIFRLNEKYAI